MSSQSRAATVEYLAEVAKDWAVSSFAAAEDSDFALAPHRFEFHGSTVRRLRLPPRSREAADPLAHAERRRKPIAWARGEILTQLADSPSGSFAYDQEIVEVLGVEAGEVVAAAATVMRAPGLPPCIGRFWTVQ
jgi:hypothetical protein